MTSSSAPPPRPEPPASPRHVHLTAIAGVGMASLAGLFREAGYHVTGSDAGIYPPMSTILASLGIAVMEGFRAENLDPRPDLVVVGNAMSRGNPEVEAMLAAAIPYCSMPEALMRFFMGARRRAVVTGTHGKTTSSALLAWVLHETGGDPGFMIGGAAKNFPYNFRVGGGPWFFTEGDEYDTAFFDKGPKFLHYAPDALLLTAVEFDHADIYRDLAHVKEAFTELLRRTTGTSPVVVSADFPEARAVVAASGRAAMTFGVAADASWRGESITDTGEATRFTVITPDRRLRAPSDRRRGNVGRAACPLPGAPSLGALRAAFEHHAPQSVPGRGYHRVPRRRSRHVRGRPSPRRAPRGRAAVDRRDRARAHRRRSRRRDVRAGRRHLQPRRSRGASR